MFDVQAISADISSSTNTDFSLSNHSPIGGGDINQAFRLQGQCGRHFFLKLNQNGRLPMFVAEAEGLRALEQAKAIRVPKPICYGETDQHAYLVMEFISFSPASSAGSAQMGEQLAALHQTSSLGQGHGWHRDNTIGMTPQRNNWCDDWVEFFRHQRLGYQLDLASTKGASRQLLEKGQFLLKNVDFYFESYQPQTSLLHGDLWSGNAGFDENGKPVIYDPATYYGDRETDIAMTELFGGFSHDFYSAYERIWPLDSGYSRRRELYNLYHILNHFNMFGSGYAAQAENIIKKLLNYLP